MRQHLIVEGPDGSGKSTLVDRLVTRYPHLHRFRKASASITGPVPDLDKWVVQATADLTFANVQYVLDRHPLISEPIYGPLVRGGVRPMFDDSPWLSRNRLSLYPVAFVIWCMPPMEEVIRNVTRDPDSHLPGLADKAEDMYRNYRRYMYRSWGGQSIRHDYTRDRNGSELMSQIDHMIWPAGVTA